MEEYKDLKTKTVVSISGDKFTFPASGTKILLKSRPPISKEVASD